MAAIARYERYEVLECGCIRYHGALHEFSPEWPSPPPRIILWCGSIRRDAAELRAAITTAIRRAARS